VAESTDGCAFNLFRESSKEAWALLRISYFESN
jgi:hypothetical protein